MPRRILDYPGTTINNENVSEAVFSHYCLTLLWIRYTLFPASLYTGIRIRRFFLPERKVEGGK
jgi:hypothetical protein